MLPNSPKPFKTIDTFCSTPVTQTPKEETVIAKRSHQPIPDNPTTDNPNPLPSQRTVIPAQAGTINNRSPPRQTNEAIGSPKPPPPPHR